MKEKRGFVFSSLFRFLPVVLLLLSGCSLDIAEHSENVESVQEDITPNLVQYQYKYLASEEMVRNITVKVTSSVSQKWCNALAVAMQRWNNIPGCAVNFQGPYTPAAGDCLMTVGVGTRDGMSKNAVAVSSLPSSDGIPGKTITILQSYDGQVLGYNQLANDDWKYCSGWIDNKTYLDGELDLGPIREEIMMHELGHAIGMTHSNEKPSDTLAILDTPSELTTNSVMRLGVMLGSPITQFTPYDIVAAQRLFPEDGVAHIRIYEHANYAGRCMVLYPHQSISDLRNFGFNDMISSVKVYGDFMFVGYIGLSQHINFGGKLLWFRNSLPNLKNNGFNDTASSINFARLISM